MGPRKVVDFQIIYLFLAVRMGVTTSKLSLHVGARTGSPAEDF